MSIVLTIFHVATTAHIKFLSKVLFSFLLAVSFLASCSMDEATSNNNTFLLNDNTAAPGPNNPFLIQNEADLARLATFVNGNQMYSINNTDGSYRTAAYRLEDDITLSGENNFTPIGTGYAFPYQNQAAMLITTCENTCFEGTFDGANNTISGLHFDNNLITDNSTTNVGLFAVISGSNTSISNLILTGVNITGTTSVGGLVGTMLNSSTISNVSATGSVNGNVTVGGLVGNMSNSSMTSAVASVTITGSRGGGLVGSMDTSSITNAFASAAISHRVITAGGVGGLVGKMQSNSSILNAVASGSVSGQVNIIGGIVGLLEDSSTLTNTLAWGSVSEETSFVNGLVGNEDRSSSTTASYWDMTVNHTPTSNTEARDTTDLQTPLSATGIYENWNNEASDTPPGAGAVWDFGTSTDYPAITGLLITVACQRNSADTSCPP